jgi:hypothetical protein
MNEFEVESALFRVPIAAVNILWLFEDALSIDFRQRDPKNRDSICVAVATNPALAWGKSVK